MGRTLDIPVICGSPIPPAHSDIAIQITRIGNGSSSSSLSAPPPPPPQRQIAVQEAPSQSRTANLKVYEVPLTPGVRPKGVEIMRNVATAEPVPRLDLMSARPCNATSIFEVPPTPPGVTQGTKVTKIREISVAEMPPSSQQVHQPEERPVKVVQFQQPQVERESVNDDIVVGVREIAVEDKGASGDQQLDDVPAVDIASPPLNSSENSLIDFSLFLLRNARAREQIRGSVVRESEKKKVSEPEDDLESLLRKWEAAQWEEEAAARAKEEEIFRSSSVVPMFPCLKDLPLLNFINSDGKIEPLSDPDTTVSVFAVYDRLKKVQYIGVSKNIRNAMRKIMGRKPGFCYYYKIYNLPKVESLPQPHSLKQRWIEELGAPPPGNADSLQRKQWEQAADVSANLDRETTALAAAIQKAKQLIQIMVERGLKEEMVYDPALMELGRCDVLEATTPAEAPKGKHTVVKTPYGGSIEYFICYNDKVKTNTGWKYDVSVNKDSEETRHLVTCGSFCPGKLTEDGFLELVMGFLLHKGIPRSKDWRNGFSMNNFSIAELVQKFDDFKPWFPRG